MSYHRDPCSLGLGMAAFYFPDETEAGEPCLVVAYTWDLSTGRQRQEDQEVQSQGTGPEQVGESWVMRMSGQEAGSVHYHLAN